MKYFNHVLSDELHDERRNPDVVARDDLTQVLFADDPFLMSR